MNLNPLATIAFAALAAAACAVPSHSGDGVAYSSDGVRNVEYGQVERVDLYTVGSEAPVAAGSLLGGISSSGAAAPMQRPSDSTALGAPAIDPALGNEIGQSRRVDDTRYRIVVRLDTDVLLTIEDRRSTDLRAGDRVRVENGRVTRVA